MADRIQLVAILGSALLFFVVLEMVRRRRLMERYALLWLLASVVLLALGIWRNGLVHISKAIGIIYPPNALFFIAFGFVLLLLLHFSSAISRLSDQTKVLAQRQALLEERLRRAEESGDSASGVQDGDPALQDAEPEHERPRYVRITRD
jgi:hypothetical protein